MATCPRMEIVADKKTFQSSTTAVKAVADSTEPRPRRIGANYELKDHRRKSLENSAPARRISARKDAEPFGRMTKVSVEQNAHRSQATSVVIVNSPPKKEVKRKDQKVVGHKQRRPRITDSTSGEDEELSEAGDKRVGFKDRLLLRQWLEVGANSGNIPGLQWLDKNEMLIRITWRHGSRSEWSTNDVNVFKCWAQHTGRYDAGNHDYKKWKANFRCALNSLQDVKEVSERRSIKTHDPYKVYRLLPAIPPKKRRRESVKSSNSSSAESSCQTPAAEETVETDGIVNDPMMMNVDAPDALTQVLFGQLLPFSSSSGAYEPILQWPSVDQAYDSLAAETLETEPLVPMTCMDHCYADLEPLNQLRIVPPSPQPPPALFNDAIPLPVQDLIDSSDEFQSMDATDEDMTLSVEALNSGPCNLFLTGDMNNVQAYTISSTNSSNLESLLQVFLSVPAIPASCEIASPDQTEQTQ